MSEKCNSRIGCVYIYNIYVIFAGCNYLVSVHTFSNCLVINLLKSPCSMLVADESLTHQTRMQASPFICLPEDKCLHLQVKMLLIVLEETE
jgi:hypothetical protein